MTKQAFDKIASGLREATEYAKASGLMAAQFTPGPWRIGDEAPGRFPIYANAPHGVKFDVCPAIAHSLFDAHLIAAAPDLYEAVRLLLTNRSYHSDADVIGRRVMGGLKRGLEAMAKARGEAFEYAKADKHARLTGAHDSDREQRMVEALRGALVVIDTLPWPSEAEAGRKVLDARAAIVAALAPFNEQDEAGDWVKEGKI